MKQQFAYRGAKVLYDFLVSNQLSGKYLLPANVCDCVPTAFAEAGCEIEYVDIDKQSLCIDEQQVLNHIHDCEGLLAVHTYGTPRDFNPFYKRLRDVCPNTVIIDDRCLCWPDFEISGLYDSAEADLILFSLGDKKQVQLNGGGVGLIKDKWRYEHITPQEISIFVDNKYGFDLQQYHSQQIIAKSHIENLQKIYVDNLPIEIQLPMEFNSWRFNIRVSEFQKQTILQQIFTEGLFASSHYRSLADSPDTSTPIAYQLQKEIINLFLDPIYFSVNQAIRVCQIINQVLQQR